MRIILEQIYVVKMKDKCEKRGGQRLIDKPRVGMAFLDNITFTVIEGEKKQGLDFNMQKLCQGYCCRNQ